ncbi:hypothetical protein ANRL2_00255 [Anaerolineae bacterium]|nr:hypothetical protein ANRL2_00255 [Anaerolineae bacterium]
MNEPAPFLDVAALRRAFDEAFARPARVDGDSGLPMLAIRAADAAVALDLAAIKAIQLCPPISEVPSEANSLLGVAAMRGSMAGMYSLAHLLGVSKARSAGNWAVTCGDGSIGLVFDELRGFERVNMEGVKRSAGGERLSSGFVEIAGSPHLLVNFTALIGEIMSATTNQGVTNDV